jgi:PKHD-type hydroxylase
MGKSMYDVVWADRAFTDSECDAILDKFLPEGLRPGLLMQQEVPDVSVRKSSIRFVPFNADDKWVFDRLAAVAARVNEQFRFELKGFDEGFQLGRYAEGDFYHWHADLGADASALRKLSLVVQLTAPEDYDGGELEFFPQPVLAPRERGTIIAFPSYMPHRVLPVRRGVRYSIASWIAGATPFR